MQYLLPAMMCLVSLIKIICKYLFSFHEHTTISMLCWSLRIFHNSYFYRFKRLSPIDSFFSVFQLALFTLYMLVGLVIVKRLTEEVYLTWEGYLSFFFFCFCFSYHCLSYEDILGKRKKELRLLIFFTG